MTAGIYKITVGRISVACFAEDASEAVARACDVINEQYPDAMVDKDTCVFEVERIPADCIDFNDEVY